jgi:RsmE family RNA methyltransferase
LHPIYWLVGLPRPQTARKLLQAGSILGVSAILFFQSEKGEASYAQSKLWSTDEWRRQLILGAEQAFATNFPKIEHAETLEAALEMLPENAARLALDVYEADEPLGVSPLASKACVLAFGPERGWSPCERDCLRRNQFEMRHLGCRVLRSELAATGATAIALTLLGAYG